MTMTNMKRNSLMWIRAASGVLLVCAATACAASRATPHAAAGPDDQTLKMRVETSLKNATGVHASEVTAEVAQAVATLSGTVHTQAEVDAAVAAARRVDGLKDVKSNLRVE
jgi:hyperosmotically inducible periplasmic protein